MSIPFMISSNTTTGSQILRKSVRNAGIIPWVGLISVMGKFIMAL